MICDYPEFYPYVFFILTCYTLVPCPLLLRFRSFFCLSLTHGVCKSGVCESGVCKSGFVSSWMATAQQLGLLKPLRGMGEHANTIQAREVARLLCTLPGLDKRVSHIVLHTFC